MICDETLKDKLQTTLPEVRTEHLHMWFQLWETNRVLSGRKEGA
jgi:hypothetical protein